MEVPVQPGRKGPVLFEDPGKAGLGRIIQVDCDLREGVVRMTEETGNFPEFFRVNIFRDLHVHLLLKTDGEGTAAETAAAGKEIQGEGLGQMDRNAGNTFPCRTSPGS